MQNMWHPHYHTTLLAPLALHFERLVEGQRLASGLLSCRLPQPDLHVFPALATWNGLTAFPNTVHSSKEAKIFLINRAVFDLVKGPLILDMNNPKFLYWYSSLPVEDQRLIMEQGGLYHFLQNHPALRVKGHLIYVKDEIIMGDRSQLQATTQLPMDGLLTLQDNIQSACNSCDVAGSLVQQPEVQMSQGLEASDPSMEDDHLGVLHSEDVLSDQKKKNHNVINEQLQRTSVQSQDQTESLKDLRPLQSHQSSWLEETGLVQNFTERANQYAREDCFTNNSQYKSEDDTDLKGNIMSTEEIMTSSPRQCMVNKFCSTEPQIIQHDAAVNTDLSLMCFSKCDQNIQAFPVSTAEKSAVTDVHMTDLDHFTQEFIKLKLVHAEAQKLKDKLKSSEGNERGLCCDGAQRAVQAELRLLALQRIMCQQHCWRRYCASPEGDRILLGKYIMPGSMMEVLQKLDDDYEEMRKDIVSGKPLDQLCPLSVDCGRIISEGHYIPAEHGQNEKMSVNTHQGHSQPIRIHTLQNMTTDGPELESVKESSTKKACHDDKSNRKVVEDECELSVEGFPHEQEMDQHFLCVKDLPNDATEIDVMLCFGKYQASIIKIENSIENLRMAIMAVSSHSIAERAVKELNGHIVKGQCVKVEHVPSTAVSVHQRQTPSSKPSRSSGHHLGSKHNTLTKEKLVNVQESPTPSGIFVPRHTIMGGFSTLMAQLLERCPDVTKKRIVDALLEVHAKHDGFLNDLPQESILDMTCCALKRLGNDDPVL